MASLFPENALIVRIRTKYELWRGLIYECERINNVSESTVARELRAVMQGRVVLPGDDDYAQTRQIWNRAVQHQPSLIAVCETSDDVQAAVRSAREHASPRSVRGGGHDWARGLCAIQEKR